MLYSNMINMLIENHNYNMVHLLLGLAARIRTLRIGEFMFYMISGGSGSGKSEYAESIAVKLAEENKKAGAVSLTYIATMMAFDDEARQKIQRHRMMRKDKGFKTIECFYGLKHIKTESDTTVLLDCMSNLTANEMFDDNGAADNAVSEIMCGIDNILAQCKNLVVVTNEIFSDGCEYDDTMKKYIYYLGSINRQMAVRADHVTEIVYGIPVHYK